MITVFAFQGMGKAQQDGLVQYLSNQQESIIPIAAFTAKGDMKGLSAAFHDGLDAGLSINEIKEILVQMYAYTGFPRSLNAISALESVINERRQKGISDKVGREPTPQNFEGGKFVFGRNVLTELTGTTATGAPQKFVPVIDTFLKEHLFADIFGRDVLDFRQREIATISALASLPGAERQLLSHLRVGRNIGFSEQQLRGIASKLSASVGKQEGDTGNRHIDELLGIITEKHDIAPVKVTAPGLQPAFARGERVNSDHFTGTVWVQMLVNTDTTFDINTGHVTFEPGARTNWHSHPGGQVLLVTSGKGRYQERGKPVREIQPGDVIRCQPDVIHWHGAAPDSEMSHIAIGTNQHKGAVKWMEPVTDEEYGHIP